MCSPARLATGLGIVSFLVGCAAPGPGAPTARAGEAPAEGPQPTPGTVEVVLAAPGALGQLPALRPTLAPTAEPVAAPGVPAAPPAPSVPIAPPLLGPDGQLLPQTKQQPDGHSELLQHRARLLFEAFRQNDPELAVSFFFPVAAYERVKAIAKPRLDWERRLVVNFRRDVATYHKKIGSDATFVGLAVPTSRARWMKPHSEGNALGYYRVLRSRLEYRDGAGVIRGLPLTSLISWRGEWYVVHINGFR